REASGCAVSMTPSLRFLGYASLLALTAACGQILGLDKFQEGSSSGGGGSGGAPPVTCSPGEVKACPYKGPGATENKGVCKAGTQTCLPNGSGFGECSGEVQPTPESCATVEDDDCDGMANPASAGCVCTPGMME